MSPLLLISAAQAAWAPMPGGPLFATPLADPRATRLSATWRSDGEIDAALGHTVPLVQYSGPVKVQAGLLFGTWLRFSPDGPGTFDLNTFDGSFGVPVDIAVEELTLRVAWRHTSAHIADGLDRPSLTYSREELLLAARYDWGLFSLYGGGAWMWKSAPELPRFGVQLGLEGQGRWWFAGLDAQLRGEDDWSPGLSAFAGAQVQRARGPILRVGPCGGLGPDRRGQFLNAEERYLGLRMDLDLLPRGRVKVLGAKPRSK